MANAVISKSACPQCRKNGGDTTGDNQSEVFIRSLDKEYGLEQCEQAIAEGVNNA
jgi:hypothetical protein